MSAPQARRKLALNHLKCEKREITLMGTLNDLGALLHDTRRLREFGYSVVEGKHEGKFERKHYIGLSLYNRCLQTHEAIQIIVTNSLVDDAWILLRALVEHVVNAIYMFHVADGQAANDFADYGDYLSYQTLVDLKATDEEAFRHHVSIDDEERERQRFERVRSRFDKKRGDKWCADNAVYKRAARVDKVIGEARGEVRSDLLWLVNNAWRHGSAYTHGTARALAAQIQGEGEGVIIQRKYAPAEVAHVLHWANFALYLVALAVDIELGSKNAAELNRMFAEWVLTMEAGTARAAQKPVTQV